MTIILKDGPAEWRIEAATVPGAGEMVRIDGAPKGSQYIVRTVLHEFDAGNHKVTVLLDRLI